MRTLNAKNFALVGALAAIMLGPGESWAGPTGGPTAERTASPTAEPIVRPTAEPSGQPIASPTAAPIAEPTGGPTAGPPAERPPSQTAEPIVRPPAEPSGQPIASPPAAPIAEPTGGPTAGPPPEPTAGPIANPPAQPFVQVTPATPSAAAATAAAPRATTLALIGEGFVLDGHSNEAAWLGVEPLPMVTYEPVYRATPTERTEIRIAYDARFLYVAARMYERDPRRIRANSLYRDQISGDDRVGVLIDPFDDNQTGLWFWTTPNGVRGDALFTNDGSSGNGDWNTHWDVAVARTDEGWFAEMRIPLSSLGFQPSETGVTMGVIADRYMAGRNERHVFPDISPDFPWQRPSLAHDVVLVDVVADRPLYITPYALVGTRREATLAPGAQAYGFGRDTPSEIGVDLRHPITPNLTLDLTANTDFAQVEVDDQQVNLTRFDLFFPEKRQFFLERAGIFAFNLGGSDRLFHSRRIGLDDGDPVRILGGTRLAGRIGEWDVGVLDMQTEASGALPGTNHGVVRLRRRVLNDYSTAGGIVTTRIGSDGAYNVAYGLDTSIRTTGDHYVGLQWAQTFDDADGTRRDALTSAGRGETLLDAALLRLVAYRAVQQGFTYSFSGRTAGPLFTPEMGFRQRTDFSEVTYWLSWAKILGEGSAIRRIDPFQLFGNVVWRNGDHSVESAFVEYDTDLSWKNGWGVWQDFELYHDDLRDPVGLPENTSIPVGSYTYVRTEGGVNTPSGSVVRGGLDWGVQSFFDGTRRNVGVGGTWDVSPHLSLNGRYQLDAVRFDQRDQGFDAHIARLRLQIAMDTRLSLSGFLQYSSAGDSFGSNVRLRYNVREGTDLWIVYDEGLRLDRALLDPRPPLSARRTFLVKYSHTFR